MRKQFNKNLNLINKKSLRLNYRFKFLNLQKTFLVNKKAQSSIEFVILITFMLGFFTLFIIFIQSRIVDANEARNQEYANQLKTVVFNEVEIAEGMPTNYTRKFTLPNYLDDTDYIINIYDGEELVITFRKKEYVYFFSKNLNPTSTINKGENQINKDRINGNIEYNIKSV